MKILSGLKYAACVAVFSLAIGCQKESFNASESAPLSTAANKAKPQEHQLKGEYTAGSYRFEPDWADGYVTPNPAPGWYPGIATVGHLNLLGKSQAMVNMYASFGASGLQGTAAPLNLFFTKELSALGITLPNEVAILFYDQQGNSIWAHGVGTIPIVVVSATRATFGGTTAKIDGGTGKFANATGIFAFSGHFNPQDSNDVGIEMTDGTIVY